jgi:hypothetical protein
MSDIMAALTLADDARRNLARKLERAEWELTRQRARVISGEPYDECTLHYRMSAITEARLILQVTEQNVARILRKSIQAERAMDRARAITVPCRHCAATVGDECVSSLGIVLFKQAAHFKRLQDVGL